jgi:hypothetical protein
MTSATRTGKAALWAKPLICKVATVSSATKSASQPGRAGVLTVGEADGSCGWSGMERYWCR